MMLSTIALQIISTIIYIMQVQYFQNETEISEPLIRNIELAGCGVVTIRMMLLDSYLNQGLLSLIQYAYVFTLFRKKILRRTSMPVQDFYTLNYQGRLTGPILARCLIRPFLAVLPITICIIPYLLLKYGVLVSTPIPNEKQLDIGLQALKL